MKLNELKVTEGSKKVRNRVGRGTSSGNGKTSGKGQDSKVDNYHYIEDYLKEDLVTQNLK